MSETLTPMIRQYQRLRASVPADTLLLFRLGDFYELFFEDAKAAWGLLNLALTKRKAVGRFPTAIQVDRTSLSKWLWCDREKRRISSEDTR
ncbi:MAG: hypothetical protein ACR2NX_04160 [Chthoniobacterales bacterium]